DEATPESNPCRNCKTAMLAGATKCKECGSFQDFRRFLGLSSSVLGLLVALVSVLAFAIPIWKETFVAKSIAPRAVLLNVAPESGVATFSISNAGDAPAALQLVALARGDAVVSFELDELSSQGALIEAGEVQVDRLSLEVSLDEDDPSLENLVRMFRGDEPCVMQAFFVDAEANRTKVDVSIPSGVEDHKVDEAQGACHFEMWSIIVATLRRLSGDPAYEGPMCRISERLRRERGEEASTTPHCAEVFAAEENAAEGKPLP
ncbi:MAG TPA: hypothetical protein VI168_17155, partial [Croceibacterium sp.]